MHKILYRPIIVISLVLGMLVMVELLALGSITWRNLSRIDKIKQDISQGHELEQLVLDLLKDPVLISGEKINPSLENTELHKKITHFFANRDIGENGTEALLDEIKPFLLNIEQGKRQDISQVLSVSQKIFNLQRSNEEKLLTQVYEDSRLELNFAVVIPIAVLLPAFLLGIRFFRRQILSPLNSLEQLLKRLTDGEMQPIEDRKDPLMQPLFSSYNRLIRRLAELEEEHVSHTQTLEREIRQATHALLEQSHTLARSERLAAVGELAASAAHELRNPLAGIQAALENMCGECTDPNITERLPLVSTEIKRLTNRLNDLLAYSKQQPETAKVINISKLVADLLTLLKYQVHENIKLIYSIPPNLQSLLPETEFRQALLNLLLNSAQELGKQGGTINLTINKQADSLKVEVYDSGQGFPENLLEQGVRPFASYREHGTGLGLSMVLRFARSLGGQLSLKNDSQGHACATLILPAGV
ncbi:histidine kinase [Methyloglobulus morosus KoM1]|uniref:histidine kinase n=1 Tax=Methyloglobulus morosus KoM1 TaxID=1116472 RepID=V5BF18_9GAMM|nr:ATP-binding protein [Methyloglobulus morosus]ESS71890.1 histidine kinase [Methyloglobulus morosus KoM1]